VKNVQMSNFMEIRPVGAELFLEDGQTDIMKLICPFRNFENALKMNTVYYNCAFLFSLMMRYANHIKRRAD
jgi:hypothetical protein